MSSRSSIRQAGSYIDRWDSAWIRRKVYVCSSLYLNCNGVKEFERSGFGVRSNGRLYMAVASNSELRTPNSLTPLPVFHSRPHPSDRRAGNTTQQHGKERQQLTRTAGPHHTWHVQ